MNKETEDQRLTRKFGEELDRRAAAERIVHNDKDWEPVDDGNLKDLPEEVMPTFVQFANSFDSDTRFPEDGPKRNPHTQKLVFGMEKFYPDPEPENQTAKDARRTRVNKKLDE